MRWVSRRNSRLSDGDRVSHPCSQGAGGGTYYKSIPATASGKTLLAALHTLISGHKELSYDDARTRMFATVDDGDNDNVVQDVYTGRKVPGIHFTCTALAARCDEPVPLQADGDIVATLPVDLAIGPRPLMFC